MSCTSVAAALCLAAAGAVPSVAEAAGPPNVLLLIADDLNTWLLDDPQRYAGRVVAPNLRALADSGVVFKRAYTASPLCSPSRTALLSGVAPWKSGVTHNGLDVGLSETLQAAKSLPAAFREAGYFTAAFGKVGHGWNGVRADWDVSRGHKRDPAPPGAPLMSVGKGEQDWGPIHLDESEMNDTGNCTAAIAELQRQSGRPFFIACGTFNPHMPWYVPQSYFDLFPVEDVLLPAIDDGDLADVPPLGVALTRGKSKFVKAVREADEHVGGVRAYLATTAYADAQLGRVIDALDAGPHRDNTVVIMISDHGFHLGEKDHWQKATLWEEATHCLMMIRVPGTTDAGGVCDRFVSLQDLYPTLAELCGLDAPDDLDGRSLTPLLRDPSSAWESTAVSTLGDRHVSIRTERFRYTRYDAEQEELYDCSADPHEWSNEAGNPAFADELARLRAALPPVDEVAETLPRKDLAKNK
ncbi:MAG: sulfatase [Planctomycetota bacterium]